ncbi:MAG: aldose 1-epimerase family protein [Chloroflexota bacterium]
MVKLFGKEMTRREIEAHVGRMDQVAGIVPSTRADGRAAGLRSLVVSNGAGLSMTCLPDRGLDISHAEYRGVPLCWRSSNGDAAASFYDDDDAEWLRTFFGGLLTTCGLTNFGPAGADQYGSFGLHGRINATPADDVLWSQRWEGDEWILEVEGIARQTRTFGEHLSLARRLHMNVGERSMYLHDVVTNHGFSEAPHMMLYHCNAGFPILAPEARLYVAHSQTYPRDTAAGTGLADWDLVTPPQPGFAEQVFIHNPIACADGRAAAALINPSLNDGQGLGLAVRFDPEQLPALIQWRMLGQGTYVMGIEPANCPTIEGRVEAGGRGTLPLLQAGESRSYDLEFQVLDGRQDIAAIIDQIEQANAQAGSDVSRSRA